MLDQDGDFRIVSTDARAAINDNDERARLGSDVDYLKVHYQPDGEYTPGVFYGKISEERDEVHIICRDSEKAFVYRVNHENKI